MERRHVFRHNTSSSHRYTSTYGNTWKHYYITTEPAILAYGDGAAQLGTVGAIPKERINGMCGRVERTARSNKCAGSDGDETGVEKGTIEVDVYSFPNPGP